MVKMVSRAKSSHVGTALSVIDILVVLYFAQLNIDPIQPTDKDRDIFILSKGHGSAALYAILALAGFVEEGRLIEYYADGGSMPGHPAYQCIPGVEASTGSLGHGLAIALGQAQAQSIMSSSSRTFVLLGDGECNEGSIWEAAMYAAHLKPRNLVAIVDCNGLQGLGHTNEVTALHPLRDKWESFGWRAIDVDGHDHEALQRAFENAKTISDAPVVILAKTVKGKGVTFMEDRLEWHYKSPNTEQLSVALGDLSK